MRFFFEGEEGEVNIVSSFSRENNKNEMKHYLVLKLGDKKATYTINGILNGNIERLAKPYKTPYNIGDKVGKYVIDNIEMEEKLNKDGSIRTRLWALITCQDCNITRYMRTDHLAKHSTYCFDCNQNKKKLKKINRVQSYGERLVHRVLKENYTEIQLEKTFPWSNQKRYDFYLPKENIVIEVHGTQHYLPQGKGQRFHLTLESQQKRDKWKKDKAIENGLSYIEIDARESDFTFIKNNLIDSNINTDGINWNSIYLDVESSKEVLKIIELYNQGCTLQEIHDVVGMHKDSIKKIVKNLNEEGFIQGYDKYTFSIRYHENEIRKYKELRKKDS